MRKLISWLLCVFAIVVLADSRLLPFGWDVEKMADSKHVQFIVINGNPAPTIRAQQGDTIVVQVRNHLGEDLVIVWQAIEKVINRQCNGADQPIPAGQAVTYCLAAKQAGEFSYQALSKLQRDAGLKGSIVVL
ncbi:hypothetical protein ACJRO7_034049 [Eucalyptus globulus]|uniref:Plastocyanin-like domain-containing protein n=1 Tax=Eucalyptus globulus TaxID=34317 RepID=A0ABD3JB20_EUCGL